MSPASQLPSRTTSIALRVAAWKYYILIWGAHHGSVRIGVGVSTARDARRAAVGAAAHARDELAGEAPSLAVLLASRSHAEQAADILNAVQETVEPPALIGCVAQAIVAGHREIEDEAAVAVWLASGLAAETFQLDFVRTGSAACSPVTSSTGPRAIGMCCCRTRTHSRRTCSSSTSTPTCRERP